jgi:hypothetical protein
MNRSSILAAACAAAVSLLAAPAFAQTDAAAKKPQGEAAAKPKKVQPPKRTTVKTQPEGITVTADTVETISINQIEIAQRVMTGTAQCEFDQKVSVERIADRPGFFKVAFKNASYTMIPQETTTGAVRLEDKKAGVMWLQIPAKSMLMNSKAGQRMVDGCTQQAQRTAM